MRALLPALCSLLSALCSFSVAADESIWIEAEHLTGVRGYCWPMGDDQRKMRETAGNWALSGPGWAAEWNQGGESGFLSIATGAADDHAAASTLVEIPTTGRYFVWVRYGDWREMTERFQIRIEQAGAAPWMGRFGERPLVDEDNEMKLYWDWAFAWDRAEVQLNAGSAKLSLLATTQDPQPRQVDVIVITTDANYRPRIKERPANEVWRILDEYRRASLNGVEPLARQSAENPANSAPPQLPDSWRLRSFADRGFVYLWNVSQTDPATSWLGERPERVKFPYNVADKETSEQFEKKFGARDDVPIFSDPRIVPTFHAVGGGIFANDASGAVSAAGQSFAKWLDAHPDRLWATMMNYHPGAPVGPEGVALFQKYRDRYVGSIAGESLGYFYPPESEMRQATAAAQTRRQLAEAFSPLTLRYNAEKYRQVYGRDLDANPYQDVIACLSVGNIVFAPLCFDWGARIVGYESSAATSSVLGMRMAFMRGAARQNGGMFATYRSCNFGDSSTIFSNSGSFHAPQNIFDNYYSVYSGAGMSWYKFDIWHQYMSGSAMFYHEQGFDEFWRPGGTTAAGVRHVQLSPKGKLVDRFLRVTAAEPDRGTPYTPVALLVDYAHGWEPAPFWPNSFNNWHQQPDRFLYGDHERMMQAYFWTAFHPIGEESQKPMTATNEVYVPGMFGDMFDVIFAYPDATKWRTIDSYPVVIATGDIELTAAEGERLAQYVERGGTLLVADAHLTGPGVAALRLPATSDVEEADAYHWHLKSGSPESRVSHDKNVSHESPFIDDKNVSLITADELFASPRFRFRPIAETNGRQLATTAEGKRFCAAYDRGQGRLVFLSIPRALTISQQPHPVLARLFVHLTRNLMPVEVSGDVEWLLNRTNDGWLVTLLNPAGQAKPQHGITPTDYRENRSVTIESQVPITKARDRLLPSDTLVVENNAVRCEVLAGSVRVIELK